MALGPPFGRLLRSLTGAGLAASLFLGWVEPARAETSDQQIAAATRLFFEGEGLRARAQLAAVAEAERGNPALRARALQTLLDICRRMQAQACLIENTQAYVDAVSASVSNDLARRTLQAFEVGYYINADRLAIGSTAALAEAMADKMWSADVPGEGLLYLRRRALRAEVLLAGGSPEEAERAISEVLAIAGSVQSPGAASYDVATILADALAGLVQLGGHERAYGLYAASAPFIAAALPPRTPEAVLFHRTAANLLLAVDDAEGAARETDAVLAGLADLELDPDTRAWLADWALDMKAALCRESPDCGVRALAEHPLAPLYRTAGRAPASLREITYLTARGLAAWKAGQPDAVAAMALSGPLGFTPEAQDRVAVEAYRQAELQSVFGSECIPARDPLKPETLAAGEVLLYPILLSDRLELLYVAGGEGGAAIFRRLPPNRSVDRQAVAKLVETVVLSLSYDGDERWKPASRQLYDLLIKPIEGELRPGSQLAIVPDGALRALPFAVLLDAENRHLVQKTRVSVAPSLTYSQPGGDDAGKGQQLLAASLELEVRLPAGYFEKLVGTGAEARLAAVTDGQRIERSWVLENFRKADLVQALNREQVDVLHLATHASFNGRSDRAFIVANGEVILLSELRQILQDARTRGDELDLLVLSACETAVGDDEASMGLAGAAVQAGAKSAIASLWPVNDIGTAALMKSFYERYRAGRSKGEALREAQMEMIQGGGVNADPNIWAAFTLIGAWR